MKGTWRRACLSLLLVAAAATVLPATSALAEKHYALIIGVDEYPKLGKSASLAGPANDAAALLAFLVGTPSLGFSRQDITVLANGPIAADGPPDSGVILGQMDKLAAAVRPGDFVYLHFGGHGTRQKARNPATEADGLDELFLPADTLPVVDGIYPNALVDDDIGARIDAIRAAGAFVFAVFDSCHSSSATRAAGAASSDVVERRLPDAADPAPVTANAEPPREVSIDAADHSGRPGENAGGLAAFFAAQTVETTPEMLLPRHTDGAQTRGLFSYALLDVLAHKPGITYRQLAEGVMHTYAVGNFSRPTPMFEGDLDRVVFGQQAVPPVLQWPVEVSGSVARLPAGTLHGLAKGAILALLSDPLAATDQAIGYVRASGVQVMSTTARGVSYGGLEAPDLSAIPAGTVARPVEIPLAFELAVAVDPASGAFAEAAGTARTAITAFAKDQSAPVNLKLGTNGDLRLIVASEATLYPGASTATEPRLWFLAPDGQVSTDIRMKPHSIGLSGGFTEQGLDQLEQNLVAVFRATGLSRLADLSTLDAAEVPVHLTVRHTDGTADTQLAASEVPIVSPGDRIYLALENRSGGAVDVDILLIGPDYSIKHMLGSRFQARDRLDTPLIGIGPDNFGIRRIMVVVREARRGSTYTDLSFLEQAGVRTKAASSDAPRAFDELIADLANAPSTRAAIQYRSGSTPKASLVTFAVESLPRD
jgi:hypothetical protein